MSIIFSGFLVFISYIILVVALRKHWLRTSRAARLVIVAIAIAGIPLAILLYPLEHATVLMGLSQLNVGLVLIITSSLIKLRKED